jgi:hypothetical protein
MDGVGSSRKTKISMEGVGSSRNENKYGWFRVFK